VTGKLYARASDAPWDARRWPNFTPQELACKCGGRYRLGCQGQYFHDVVFLDNLQELRRLEDCALYLTSACRCDWRNGRVGGADKSEHKLRIAGDIRLAGHDPVRLARNAAKAGFTGIGFGKSFLHVDNRPKTNKPSGKEGFHYPEAQAAWTRRFGFDPAERFDRLGTL
jgi:hypothetical protein